MFRFLLITLFGVFSLSSNVFGDTQIVAEQLKNSGANLREIASNLKELSTPTSGVNNTPVLAEAISAVKSAATLAEDAAQKAAATPKDNNEWTGDHVQILSNLEGLTKVGDTSGAMFVAPANVRFDVSKDENNFIFLTSRGNYSYTTDRGTPVKVQPGNGHNIYGSIANLLNETDIDVNIGNATTQALIEPKTSYKINKSAIEDIVYKKYGWTYGLLVIPYKYQTHDKSISFAPSYQGYFGYKRDKNGTAEGPILSFGFTSADIPTGAGTSNSKQGLSYGLGWLFEIKKGSGFQLIAVIGQDKIDSTYLHNGETWVSVTFGFSLDPTTK